jgi:large subunit ribosomal protein L4
LWAGGGTVHPPKPRDYSESFPKKKRRGAMKLILTDKLKSDRLMVVENLELDSHRTRDFTDLLKKLKIEGKVLLVDGKDNRNLYLSSRNLQKAKMVPTGSINVYDLLNHELLLISKQAVLDLQEVLKK